MPIKNACFGIFHSLVIIMRVLSYRVVMTSRGLSCGCSGFRHRRRGCRRRRNDLHFCHVCSAAFAAQLLPLPLPLPRLPPLPLPPPQMPFLSLLPLVCWLIAACPSRCLCFRHCCLPPPLPLLAADC